MIVREMTQEDILYVKNNTNREYVVPKQNGPVEYNYAFELDGKILAIGGLQLIIPNTARCFVILSSYAKGHIIELYRAIKNKLDESAKEADVRRLQACIDHRCPEAVRMIKHLGFELESRLKGFLPDGDAYMYRRLV